MASLFTSQTPASGNVSNGNSISLGTYFTPTADDVVSALRWYFPTGAQPGGEAVKGALFRTSDSVKIAGDVTFTSPGTPGGWNQVAITPTAILAGVQYCVAVRSPDLYVATTGGASPWPLTNGNLSAPSGAGRFEDDDGDGSVQFPTDSFNNGCYFADVVTGVSPAEGTVALGLNLAVAATGGADADGMAALGLGLAVVTSGSAPAQGSASLVLNLALAGAGARDSHGAAALGLGLALSATGARSASGTVALGLNFAVSASGSNGESGRPVTPWPFPQQGPSTYPWTPRAVKSFSEVDS